MAGPLNATVVLSRCSKSKKLYGIRVEQRGREWVRTWAFKIDERKAKNEKFDSNQVTLGEHDPDDSYPGCPYCGAVGIALDSDCDKLMCTGGIINHGDYIELTCPWCGGTSEYGVADGLDVRGGGY
jgi:predicted RNA-binding Zn-ribbon protein involved in translation (DUF1610 family)